MTKISPVFITNFKIEGPFTPYSYSIPPLEGAFTSWYETLKGRYTTNWMSNNASRLARRKSFAEHSTKFVSGCCQKFQRLTAIPTARMIS